jgi:hypothetical protein
MSLQRGDPNYLKILTISLAVFVSVLVLGFLFSGSPRLSPGIDIELNLPENGAILDTNQVSFEATISIINPQPANSFFDHYTTDIHWNQYVDQSSINDVRWDGNSSYYVSASPGPGGPVSDPDLLAYWKMDNSLDGGIAIDSSIYGRNATCSPGLTCPIFEAEGGKFAGAYRFENSNHRLSPPNFDIQGNEMTISAWIFVFGSPSGVQDGRIISKATGTSLNEHWWMLSLSEQYSRMRFRLKTNGQSVDLIANSGPTVPHNTWVHVAAVYTGSHMILYQDGQEVGRLAKTGNIDVDSSVAMGMGNQPTGVTENKPFGGKIDDLMVLSRALDETTIQQMAWAGYGGSFSSVPISTGEFNTITAEWIQSGSGAHIDLSTDGGQSWCSLASGVAFTGSVSCPLSSPIKYRARFTSDSKLDSILLTWENSTGPTGPICGNEIIEQGEQCDGSNLGGVSCESLGFFGGNLGCYSAGHANQCQFDTSGCTVGPAGGWTEFTPSQDTKIIYVSSSQGNNNTCQAYDASQIPDPNNPPAFVIPCQTPQRGYQLLRGGFPDWMLLKSGDEWTFIGQDNVIWWAKSGRSSSEKMLVGSYGIGARPKINTGRGSGITSNAQNNRHVAFIDLHFNQHLGIGHGGSAYTILGNWDDVLVENNFMENYRVAMVVQGIDERNPSNIALRRNIMVDQFTAAKGHSQGVYIDLTNGLLLEENVFDYNGWRHDFMDHDFLANPNLNTPISQWASINDGKLYLYFQNHTDPRSITSFEVHVSNINFNGVTSMHDIAARLQQAINNQAGFNVVSVQWYYYPRANYNYMTFKGQNNFVAFHFAGNNLSPGTNLNSATYLDENRQGTAGATMFNHNAYLQSDNNNVVTRGNIFSRGSSHGLQQRSGGLSEDNLFIQNPIGGSYGYSAGGGAFRYAGLVRNNVVLDSRDIRPHVQRGHGMWISHGRNMVLENNIIAHQREGNDTAGINIDYRFGNMTLRNNIVYDWAKNGKGRSFSFFGTMDGPVNITGNDFQQVSGGDIVFKGSSVMFNSNYAYSGNRYFSTKNTPFHDFSNPYTYAGWIGLTGEQGSSFGQVQYHDSERDIGKYMQSLGMAPTLDAFMQRARMQSKNNWDERFTSYKVNEYIREGFTCVSGC